MKRDRSQEALSRYFDGELTEAETGDIEQLLLSSEEAREYLDRLGQLRQHLRYETVDLSPDVTRRVLAAIKETRPRRPVRRLRVAAAFVAGIVAGVAFIGLSIQEPAPVAAAEIPDQVLAAQGQVTSLTARLHIVERGWHPDVAERVFVGQIAYRAPESLWVEIRDNTAYPSSSWVPNHITFVVDEELAWSRSVAGCPTEALPNCTPSKPRLLNTTDREPFPDAFPAPLDLIVPVTSFSRAGEPGLLGFKEVDGRRAIGVVVTAAQVAPLVEGLISAGNWREVHPTDRVELWLDQDALVPLAFSVFPANTPDRRLWAIRRGYSDQAEVAVLEVTWTEVVLGGAMSTEFPQPPDQMQAASAGFRDESPTELEALTPGRLPDGMTIHRTGTIVTAAGPSVSVASWSDGRAWLKIRWTSDWRATRLFGELGTLVREVPLGTGVAYSNERGDRIGVHGNDVDLVLLGSLPTEILLEIAGSLDVTGRSVPNIWAEAATSTLSDAHAAVAGLLLPVELEGFGSPAIRVEPEIAILAYAGPGNRAFLLTEAVDDELSPPLEANERGVAVRGTDGRYSPDRGLLEWVEGNLVISLTSSTMSLEELVAIAESLREQ